MSYTRLIYDTKAYQTDLHQSMGPLDYSLKPWRNNHTNKEVVYKPGFKLSHAPVISNKSNIDIESELQRLYYKSTKYPGYKYSPDCDLDSKCYTGYPCGCDTTECNHLQQHKENSSFQTEYSRLEIDTQDFKDACYLQRHFEPVNIDEQKLNRVIYQENSRGGMDTRNALKDNFRQCTDKKIKDQDNLILQYGELKK